MQKYDDTKCSINFIGAALCKTVLVMIMLKFLFNN